MRNLYQHFKRCQRGVAGVEAAILLPVMIFLIFGCMEMYQYYRAAALMDRVAFTVANSVSMQQELADKGQCTKTDDICVYGLIAKDLFQPLDYANRGGLVISAYAATEPAGKDPVSWKNQSEWSKPYHGVEAGDLDRTSRLTDKKIFPPAVVGDTVIVVEVFYDYEPFVISSRFWEALAGTSHMYSRFFFRPRFDDLRNLSK
ncbi:pilus assembly protein [Alcaligenaceae bacterium]|nr:pilus assembly protein [Alcaligenaceae bacterium]